MTELLRLTTAIDPANPLVLVADIIFCQKLKILCSKSLLALSDGYSLAITFG
jgi:hypothetical protein